MFDKVEKVIEQYALDLSESIVKSIAQHGLLPLNKIKQNCLVNFVLGTATVQKSICVNHLELKNRSAIEIEEAFKSAVWEEFTGIFGISLERAWPFFLPKQAAIMNEQIAQRLSHNMIFILKPPTLRPVAPPDYKIAGSTRSDAVIYTRGDGISQFRGELLTGGKIRAERVTELKTYKEFPSADILAVLVPEKLMGLASKYFNKNKLISVPLTTNPVNLVKLPNILNYLHNQEESVANLSCRVPDYEHVLKTVIMPKYPDFALHAARLIAPCDISVRYVADVSEANSFLKKAFARTIVAYPDNTGWVAVHTSQVYKPSEPQLNIMQQAVKQAHGIMASEHKSLTSAPQINSEDQLLLGRINKSIRDALNTAKKTNKNFIYSEELDEIAQRNLSQLGIRGINLGHHVTLTFPSKYTVNGKKDIDNLVKVGQQEWEKTSRAAIKIQSAYRGYRVRLWASEPKNPTDDTDNKLAASIS